MAITLTPTEELFVIILETYTNLFPDNEHQLNDVELFERHLKSYTYEELCDIRNHLIAILRAMSDVIDAGQKGGNSYFRLTWVKHLPDVVKAIGATARTVQDEAMLRLN